MNGNRKNGNRFLEFRPVRRSLCYTQVSVCQKETYKNGNSRLGWRPLSIPQCGIVPCDRGILSLECILSKSSKRPGDKQPRKGDTEKGTWRKMDKDSRTRDSSRRLEKKQYYDDIYIYNIIYRTLYNIIYRTQICRAICQLYMSQYAKCVNNKYLPTDNMGQGQESTVRHGKDDEDRTVEARRQILANDGEHNLGHGLGFLHIEYLPGSTCEFSYQVGFLLASSKRFSFAYLQTYYSMMMPKGCLWFRHVYHLQSLEVIVYLHTKVNLNGQSIIEWPCRGFWNMEHSYVNIKVCMLNIFKTHRMKVVSCWSNVNF